MWENLLLTLTVVLGVLCVVAIANLIDEAADEEK